MPKNSFILCSLATPDCKKGEQKDNKSFVKARDVLQVHRRYVTMLEKQEEFLTRAKRQQQQSEYEGDADQQRPSVWQEVLQIMGEGVKQMFKQVSDRFKQHQEEVEEQQGDERA